MNTARKLTPEEIVALPKGTVIFAEIRNRAFHSDDSELPFNFLAFYPFVIWKSGIIGFTSFDDGHLYKFAEILAHEFKTVSAFWDEMPDADMLGPDVSEEFFEWATDAELKQVVNGRLKEVLKDGL